jgi:hypothetical protein
MPTAATAAGKLRSHSACARFTLPPPSHLIENRGSGKIMLAEKRSHQVSTRQQILTSERLTAALTPLQFRLERRTVSHAPLPSAAKDILDHKSSIKCSMCLCGFHLSCMSSWERRAESSNTFTRGDAAPARML